MVCQRVMNCMFIDYDNTTYENKPDQSKLSDFCTFQNKLVKRQTVHPNLSAGIITGLKETSQ